jgi:hypothetical protein
VIDALGIQVSLDDTMLRIRVMRGKEGKGEKKEKKRSVFIFISVSWPSSIIPSLTSLTFLLSLLRIGYNARFGIGCPLLPLWTALVKGWAVRIELEAWIGRSGEMVVREREVGGGFPI